METLDNTPETGNDSDGHAPAAKGKRIKVIPFLITFVVMLVTWVVFSGKFDPIHLSLGVISSLLVAYFTSDQLITNTSVGQIPMLWGRFVLYFP